MKFRKTLIAVALLSLLSACEPIKIIFGGISASSSETADLLSSGQASSAETQESISEHQEESDIFSSEPESMETSSSLSESMKVSSVSDISSSEPISSEPASSEMTDSSSPISSVNDSEESVSSSEALSSSEPIISSSEPVSSSPASDPVSSSEPVASSSSPVSSVVSSDPVSSSPVSSSEPISSSSSASSASSASTTETESLKSATLTFGDTKYTGSSAVSEDCYDISGTLDITSVSATKAFCESGEIALRLGSSSATGSLTLNFDSTVVESVYVYAFNYVIGSSSALTVTSSAVTSVNAQTLTEDSCPDLEADGYLAFNGLDGGAGKKSTSITITNSTSRACIAKIVINKASESVSEEESEEDDTPLSTITLDSDDFVSYSYSDGNYCTVSDSTGYDFRFYRAVGLSTSSKLAKFLSGDYSSYITAPKAISGSVANYSAISDIRKIEITYSCNADAKLYHGYDSVMPSYETLSSTEKSVSFAFKKNSTNYFRLEAGANTLEVTSIVISYSDATTAPARTSSSSGKGKYRLNPTVYSGTLTDGVSVEVPTSITVNGSSYTVNTKKKYTYYSYSYVSADTSYASAAAYTDPMDVANYYAAFGTYPANFVSKSNFSTAKTIFGNKTRCVTQYSRTNGYAMAVPYATQSGSPKYYELDMALDSSYSSSNRGSGRLVIWDYGFSSDKGATGYSSDPVAVYTDDHYSTFVEYYYNGEWSNRFNSYYSSSVGISCATDYEWGAPTTL